MIIPAGIIRGNTVSLELSNLFSNDFWHSKILQSFLKFSEKPCKNECWGNGQCDFTTGACHCELGYSGPNCECKFFKTL